MSVPKSQRGESSMQFLYTARELEIFTIRKCANFPKRYTFYISQPIANLATSIHQHVKMANSIYPQNKHEAQIRRDWLLTALSQLNAMVSEIEVAEEMFGIEAAVMDNWMGIIDREIRLIKALLKSDSERYKGLE